VVTSSSGDPLWRISGALIGDDQQMIDIVRLHHQAQGAVAPRILGVREPRELLLEEQAAHDSIL
jgi:hypothetical protein